MGCGTSSEPAPAQPIGPTADETLAAEKEEERKKEKEARREARRLERERQKQLEEEERKAAEARQCGCSMAKRQKGHECNEMCKMLGCNGNCAGGKATQAAATAGYSPTNGTQNLSKEEQLKQRQEEIKKAADEKRAAAQAQIREQATAAQKRRLPPCVASMKTIRLQIKELAQIGSPSEADILKLEKARQRLDSHKQEMVRYLMQCPKDVRFTCDSTWTAEGVDDFAAEIRELLKAICLDGDTRPNSTDWLRAVLLKMEERFFSEVIKEENLLLTCCADGNVEFLKVFLQANEAIKDCFDPATLIHAASNSQTARIPLTRAVLGCEEVLQPVAMEVGDRLQEFFEHICSHKEEIPKEVRTGRIELLGFMLRHDDIAVDPFRRDGDGYNSFDRCCLDGDLELLLLLRSSAKEGDIQPSAPLQDGASALVHAVMRGHIPLVRELLKIPGCDAAEATPKLGSALSAAEALPGDVGALMKATLEAPPAEDEPPPAAAPADDAPGDGAAAAAGEQPAAAADAAAAGDGDAAAAAQPAPAPEAEPEAAAPEAEPDPEGEKKADELVATMDAAPSANFGRPGGSRPGSQKSGAKNRSVSQTAKTPQND